MKVGPSPMLSKTFLLSLILFLFFFLSSTLVSAINIGITSSNTAPTAINIPMALCTNCLNCNYSGVNVNNSFYWQGLVPGGYIGNWYNHTIPSEAYTDVASQNLQTNISNLNSSYVKWWYNHTAAVNTLWGKWFYNMSDGSYNDSYVPYSGATGDVDIGSHKYIGHDAQIIGGSYAVQPNTAPGSQILTMDQAGITVSSIAPTFTLTSLGFMSGGSVLIDTRALNVTGNITSDGWIFGLINWSNIQNAPNVDSTYNASYDACIPYAYNQTYTGGTYNLTYQNYAYNMTTTSIYYYNFSITDRAYTDTASGNLQTNITEINTTLDGRINGVNATLNTWYGNTQTNITALNASHMTMFGYAQTNVTAINATLTTMYGWTQTNVTAINATLTTMYGWTQTNMTALNASIQSLPASKITTGVFGSGHYNMTGNLTVTASGNGLTFGASAEASIIWDGTKLIIKVT